MNRKLKWMKPVLILAVILLCSNVFAQTPDETLEPLDYNDMENWVYSGTEDSETLVSFFCVI